MKVRIGVIGNSGQVSSEVAEKARAVGRMVGERGAVLMTGGRDGVMEHACRGAHEAGGFTAGILPGYEVDDANPHVDLAVTTGLGFDMRSNVLIRACQAVLMLGGGIGTLNELSLAYLHSIPIVVIRGTGGWADRLERVAYRGRYLDERMLVAIEYADTPEEGVAAAFAALPGRDQCDLERDHRRPLLTADVVVFRRSSGRGLDILLIRRRKAPYRDHWALPGGFVEIDENLEEAAARELREETSLEGLELAQVGAFGAVDRDPRDRVITVAYYSVLPEGLEDRTPVRAGDDAGEAAWFGVDDLPPLAFDHEEILSRALEKLRRESAE